MENPVLCDPLLDRRLIVRPKVLNNSPHLREDFILPKLQLAIQQQIELWALRFPAGTKLLDLGCGQQPYRELIEKKQFRYSSFDVVQNEDSSVDFLGRIDQSELPENLVMSGPYDLIIATEVMEHVLDWNQAFKNLSKILSPKGEVLITCPFVFPTHEEPFDFWRPTSFALAAFSQNHNFELKVNQPLGSATDCLGLIVGHLLVGMRYKTPSNLWQRASFSIQQRVLKGILKGIHWLVRKGFFEPNFGFLKDFYVSNVVVLGHQSTQQSSLS